MGKLWDEKKRNRIGRTRDYNCLKGHIDYRISMLPHKYHTIDNNGLYIREVATYTIEIDI